LYEVVLEKDGAVRVMEKRGVNFYPWASRGNKKWEGRERNGKTWVGTKTEAKALKNRKRGRKRKMASTRIHRIDEGRVLITGRQQRETRGKKGPEKFRNSKCFCRGQRKTGEVKRWGERIGEACTINRKARHKGYSREKEENPKRVETSL